MTKTGNERITRIQVRLPRNPLKWLNAYVVRGSARNLLIDTGFNLPESYEDLSGGIAALALDMHQTDIFLTHCHADHTGLVSRVVTPDSAVYIGDPDRMRIEDARENREKDWKRHETKQLLAGFPPAELRQSMAKSPALVNVDPERFEMIGVQDGAAIDLGDVRLKTVFTPGHSPGHMCLYWEEEKILFSGDHVLFDITPNITDWPEMEDSLQEYLDSLERVRRMDVRLALPSHRESGDYYARIDSLKAHHAGRLADAYALIQASPGSTGYEIASKMTWNLRNATWEEFPLSQKTFAVGEAMSHIYHLQHRGRLRTEEEGGVLHFFVNP
jgi:glyoxylase-like metal-dependent hydrolase (beta-lactamase superfamily II)